MKRCACQWIIALLLCSLIFYVQYALASKPQEIKGKAKEFVELLAKEDFTTALRDMEDTFRRLMPAEKLEERWKNLIAQVGPFKKQIRVRTEEMQQYDAVFITCQFENTPFDIKLVFNESNYISGLWFVPSPDPDKDVPLSSVQPDPFQEKEVTVGEGEWVLPGTLTIPEGDGPFPAVVLVHSFGPNDRDGTIGPNKPFRDLAWGLAFRGIAVLRYEKRTREHASKINLSKENFTVKEETIEDALAAASLLRKTDRIDMKKIFMLGHGLGGILIPRIGAQDPNIAGFIIMAGGSKPLTDLYLEQLAYLCSLSGNISEEELEQYKEAQAQVAKAEDPKLSKDTPASELPFNTPASYWLDLRSYHPLEVAKSLKQPILILQGERDYQITTENFYIWKKALSAQKNVTFKSYPKLNHLFMKGVDKSTPKEYLIPKHVEKVVIDDIANWIKKI
jgi:dienelactone hydrolase